MARPLIIVLVGLPGSGKSTWAREQALPVLSSDATRAMLTGDETDQTINRQVFSALRETLRRRIALGAPATVVDSTALSPRERRCWIRMAQLHDCEIEAVHFDIPVEECLRRNAMRERRVPEDVVRRMAARLQPPTLAEGFDRIRRVTAATAAAPPATESPE